MEIECIKDQKGKDHLAFNELKFNIKESIGDKLEDFEIIKFLGEEDFGLLYKVLSLVNKKIYAMKVLDLAEEEFSKYNLSKKQKKEYFTNEIAILESLNHPNIIKYYNILTMEI